VLLAVFVFALLFGQLFAAAPLRSNIKFSSDKSNPTVVSSVQKRFGRALRRKKIAGRNRPSYKKRSPVRLKTTRRKPFRINSQKTSKTPVRMTDKNNDPEESDTSTKNEAKKAGTFDGDLRNLPPVKPVRQERPKRKDPPTKPRVLVITPENPKKN
jgi:hypothetical protein